MRWRCGALAKLPTMTQAARLLLVDDDPEIAQLLSSYLGRFGHEVVVAGDGIAMWQIWSRGGIDLVLMDQMLPGADGLSLLRRLRETSSVPVIMLSACAETTDRVLGLEVGADDYVAKPFEPRELLARIDTVLRRSRNRSTTSVAAITDTTAPVRFGRWELDTVARQLKAPTGLVVALSNAEFRLLTTFLQRPNRLFTRDQLMDLARGRSMDAFERSIDLLVSRLRQKLTDDPQQPSFIKTVRGAGYVFSTAA